MKQTVFAVFQASDPSKYEMILKNQLLIRRLITKSTEIARGLVLLNLTSSAEYEFEYAGVTRQNDSHARQTLESNWRPPETL
ncbi:hypothetical protein PoB_006064100 [Plakobranchus ocellatus]|uniref:Uncharacterized protein n=1 Tax=Plakobranchus ocellatus TaxID=259542 RepID=A0AAV4CQI0_9GAST|nr:hypothetical protein PoB_006064100 [Plakobranchus ocellatus]